MNLLGRTPDMTEGYCECSEDTSKRSIIDEEYHSCNNDDNSKLDSWEWIGPKEFAMTTQEQQIPQEYTEFQYLFKQPKQPELPDYGPHDH